MDAPKTKTDLLHNMAIGRKEWEETLAQLSDQDLKVKGVEGEWSIKDILAQVCAYQQYMAATLADEKGGSNDTAALDSWYQTNLTMHRREHPELPESVQSVTGDQVNQVFVAAYRFKTPAEVRSMEAQAYQKLLDWVNAYPEAELAASYANTKRSLLQIIPQQCYEHYAIHIPTIRAWMTERKTG